MLWNYRTNWPSLFQYTSGYFGTTPLTNLIDSITLPSATPGSLTSLWGYGLCPTLPLTALHSEHSLASDTSAAKRPRPHGKVQLILMFSSPLWLMFTSVLFRFLATEENPSGCLRFPALANSNEVLLVIPWITALLAYLYIWHVNTLNFPNCPYTKSSIRGPTDHLQNKAKPRRTAEGSVTLRARKSPFSAPTFASVFHQNIPLRMKTGTMNQLNLSEFSFVFTGQ